MLILLYMLCALIQDDCVNVSLLLKISRHNLKLPCNVFDEHHVLCRFSGCLESSFLIIKKLITIFVHESLPSF